MGWQDVKYVPSLILFKTEGKKKRGLIRWLVSPKNTSNPLSDRQKISAAP